MAAKFACRPRLRGTIVVAALILASCSLSHAGALKARAATARVAAGQWPEILSFTTPLPLPRRQMRIAAERESWARAQTRWRHGQLARATAHARSVDKLFSDYVSSVDTDDSYWADVTTLLAPGASENDAFWEAVCNTTLSSVENANLGSTIVNDIDNATASGTDNVTIERPFDDWVVAENTTCSDEDMLAGEFTDETSAYEGCGVECASIVDIGCTRTTFKLCKIGALETPSANSSTCLRRRLPDHRPPDGKPQPPQEHAVWRAFCTQAGVRYRLLWAKRLCTVGLELVGAHSEGRCAELAAVNPSCSDVFDYQEATPPACRCVQVGTTCQAQATADSELEANVFIRVHVAGTTAA